MARRHELLYALNAGGVDPEAIARVDLEKMRIAAEHPMANLLPRVLGPATLRPGSRSLTRIPNDAEVRCIPFLRSLGTSYILLMTPGEMRIALDGEIQQVPSVSTTVSATSWTDASTSPATARVPGRPMGLLLAITDPNAGMLATSTALSRVRQTITVAGADQATQHVLRVVVERGPIFLRVGTSSGGQEIIEDIELDTGTHKIAFTPNAATIYLQMQAEDPVLRLVSDVRFEAAGDLVIPTPWDTIDRIKLLRTWQSVDTLFVGDGTAQQRRIEHRGPLSWGIALYKTDDGPFVSGSQRITLTPSAQTGNITIAASDSVFQSGHVGALVEMTQAGKNVSQEFTGVDQTSDYVTVIGVASGRYFYLSSVDTPFVGTCVLERSYETESPSVWSTYATYTNDGVGSEPLTANNMTSLLVDDGQDNLTVHYRFRVTAYTSGSVTVTINYGSGVQIGRARITDYASPTSVAAEVVRTLGNTSATRNWRIGDWSDVRGWPRTPIIHDDRMHWFRDDVDYAAKVSDYYTFDDTGEGDSEAFTRSVGVGGQTGVVWAMSLEKLVVGTEIFEAAIAASELDEPLTPTKYTVRQPSRQGCLDLNAVPHAVGGFFVQRSGRRLYEISVPDGSSKYRSQEMSRLNPAAYRAGITRHAVQQQPDTRHWAVVDGDLVCLTYDRDDKVAAVTTAEIAGGTVEDVCELPATDQDDVYLIVNRSGARYLECFAKEADQRAKSTCALLDAHKVISVASSSISGGTHLAGQTVTVWADGVNRGTVTLDGSGNAALGGTYSRLVYGLPFTASFNSVKLAHAASLGTALGQTKIVHGASVILSNSCLDGVKIGPDADHLDPMPDVVNGAARTANQFFTHYDADIFPINSEWTPDARIYFQIDSAEGPCTVQAIVLDVETKDGADASGGN